MRVKIIIILIIMAAILFISGIAYSQLTSNATLGVSNQFLAKFIFDAKQTDSISIPLADLKPGDEVTYNFSVTNNLENKRSNVNIEYYMNVETFHFMPLSIKLYKIASEEQLVLNCDESYSRNDENKLICNTNPTLLSYDENREDEYKLVIKFDEKYNSLDYVNLVDYIDININSYQKTD